MGTCAERDAQFDTQRICVFLAPHAPVTLGIERYHWRSPALQAGIIDLRQCCTGLCQRRSQLGMLCKIRRISAPVELLEIIRQFMHSGVVEPGQPGLLLTADCFLINRFGLHHILLRKQQIVARQLPCPEAMRDILFQRTGSRPLLQRLLYLCPGDTQPPGTIQHFPGHFPGEALQRHVCLTAQIVCNGAARIPLPGKPYRH